MFPVRYRSVLVPDGKSKPGLSASLQDQERAGLHGLIAPAPCRLPRAEIPGPAERDTARRDPDAELSAAPQSPVRWRRWPVPCARRAEDGSGLQESSNSDETCGPIVAGYRACEPSRQRSELPGP